MQRSPALEISPDVVCSPLDDGGVLLDLTTKQYFALNASGLVVWQFLEDGGSLETLDAALAVSNGPGDGFGLSAFAETLVAKGLASRGSSNGGASADQSVPVPALPASWTAPQLTPHGRPLAQVILSPFDPTVPVPE